VTHFSPRIPGGTDGSQLPVQQSVVHVTFAPGSLVQQAGESTTAFADRVVAALREKAMAQSGDTFQIPFN
jgi:hypothetical protein